MEIERKQNQINTKTTRPKLNRKSSWWKIKGSYCIVAQGYGLLPRNQNCFRITTKYGGEWEKGNVGGLLRIRGSTTAEDGYGWEEGEFVRMSFFFGEIIG